jgi:pimeloyl-ACP methyl ester carboxylesterase
MNEWDCERRWTGRLSAGAPGLCLSGFSHIHYNKFPKGCHFATWEQPEFFVTEMRASFKSFR